MRHNELHQFTNKELSNFQNGVLKLDKYEIIAKAESSTIELPVEVQEKLYILCTELKKRVPEETKSLSSTKLKTVSEVAQIISCLIATIKNLNDMELVKISKQCFDQILSLIN